MAVTATITRSSHSYNNSTNDIYCTLNLTGTYATGGFTISPFSVAGNLGTGPVAGGTRVWSILFFSPTGYIYTQSTTSGTSTIKIFSSPGTELSNGAALPDATLTCTITTNRV